MALPKKLFKELASKVTMKEGMQRLSDLSFSASSTSVSSVIKTTDLRFDCHKNSNDATMATGVIQVNREAKNSEAKKYIRGSSKDHVGTHQVIAKIPFRLGQHFDPQDLASRIEAVGEVGSAPDGTSTVTTLMDVHGQSHWLDESSAAQNDEMIPNWQWDAVRRSNYYTVGSCRTYQDEEVQRADTVWQWDLYVRQNCMWYNGVYIIARRGCLVNNKISLVISQWFEITKWSR